MYKGRDISDYINDILAAISEIESFTRNMSYEQFENDKKKSTQ